VTFKSGIKTMTEMKGKRISVGKAGAATERNARELLSAAGVTFDNLSKKEYLGWSQSVQAMKDGKLDGGLFQGAPPTAALVDLYTSKVGQVIPLTDKEIEAIEAGGVMYRVALKPGTYPHQEKPIQTVARQNLFIVSADAPDDLVYSLTKIMYENLAYLKRSYHGFKPIDPTAPFAGTIKSGLKAHPGAIKYFQEKGVQIPNALIP
jgi:TRAP transporter TAXI family solute receptor